MGLKLQKIAIYIILLMISLLFVYLFIAVDRDIEHNKIRDRGYMNNLIINEIKQTQSEIMSIFELFLKKSRELQEYPLETIDLNTIVTEEINLSYIEFVSYIRVDEYISFYPIYNSDFSVTKEIEERIRSIESFKFREFVYSDHSHVFFIFPVTLKDNKLETLLFISISYEKIIDSHLLSRLEELFENDSYIIKLIMGEDINNNKVNSYDSLFNLDEIFTLRDREDYFKKVRNIKKDQNGEVIIKEQNLYLSIYHPAGGIDTLYTRKKVLYFIGLFILYISIILPLIYIHLTHLNLKRSVEREKVFTALISHELKTPLSVIQLGAENLKSGVVEDREGVLYYGNLITEQAFKLKKMIEGVLTLSTIDHDKGEMVLHPVSCIDMVEEVLENLSTTIKKHNVTIVKEYGEGEFIIPCHPVSVTSCLQNIIDNGVIYGASKSENRELKITIEESARGRRAGIKISVKDYGPGIAASEWNSIFRSYYRGRDVVNDQIPGNGLGLAISRKIINKLGGSLTLNRSFKKGATFEVWLPGISV